MCIKRQVSDSIVFQFFWSEEKSCATADIRSRLKSAHPVRKSLGMQQYVQLGDAQVHYPLTFFGKRIAQKKKIDPVSLVPFRAERFEVLWNVQDLAKVFELPHRWLALLQETKSEQVIAYAYGSVSEEDKTVSVFFVSTYPSTEWRGKGFCTILMTLAFAEIKKRLPRYKIILSNVAGVTGYKCYSGAANKNAYKTLCRDEQCEDMEFVPSS